MKIPVTDLRRSAGWYRRLLDLELAGEFAEQGELRGVILMDKTGAYGISLRDRQYCASQPDLTDDVDHPSPASQALRRTRHRP